MPIAPFAFTLASASPARRSTLHAAGVEACILVSDVDEPAEVASATQRFGPLAPDEVALVLARAKAEDVAGQAPAGLVLGCDSVLELDGEIHGKPADAAEAIERWQRMRGRAGTLHTGHWLIDTRPVATAPDPTGEGTSKGTGATFGATASTIVRFADLSDAEIESYVATGEPLQVAGAFAIDGLGGAFVTGIDGDHHNVVGLSLPLLRELIAELGVDWFDLVRPGLVVGSD